MLDTLIRSKKGAAWTEERLGDHIEITHGFGFKGEYFVESGNFKLLTPGHFHESGGFRDIGSKQKFYLGSFPQSYLLGKHDLVVAMTEQADGLLGSAVFIPTESEYLHNQRIGKIVFLAERIDKGYLYWVFNSQSYRDKVRETAAGTKVKHTSPTKLTAIEILIPPLPEQRAIAEALGDVDALIAAQEKLIAKKRAIKTATMQRLLTGKERLPGFGEGCGYKQTEIGVIPEDWEVEELGNVSGFITKGSTPTTYGFQWERQGILFLRSECVSDSGLDLAPSMFISEAAHRSLNRSEIRREDILMTITGNVGRVAIFNAEVDQANINQHIARIRIEDSEIDRRFVYHYFSQETVRRELIKIVTGLAYPQLSLKQVREALFPRPSFREQASIAEILTAIDNEIIALENRLAKTKAIKQGMMQELLTGRTRFV